MTVSSLAPVTSAAAAAHANSAIAATNTLNYNDFLTLLMTELQHQDPTQPMDPTQMVSQLATVSQVGQAVQTNTTLSSLLTTSQLAQAEQLVGQSITSTDGRTSGVVDTVTVSSTGVTANLAGGGSIPLSTGAIVQ